MSGGTGRPAALPWESDPRTGPTRGRLDRLADEILSRCRGEGPANCGARCPLGVDARGYVQLTRHGRFREALQLVREVLPFPGVLGYLCTHPCELHCKRLDTDSAIRVRDIKRFLAEWEPGEPQHRIDCAPRRAERVAVVGAGPSGLIAAHDLTRAGYHVTLLEREAEIGGCLAHKIPAWRLPRHIVSRDLSIIQALKIDVRTGVRVGRDVALADLRAEHRAVVLSCGYEGALDLLRDEETGLGRTIRETIRIDPCSCETGVPGLFAGGDAVSGPGTVIDALASGRRCAESARRFMEGRDLREGRERTLPRRLLWTLEIDEAERRRRERSPVLLRPFNDPMTEAEARAEADRCIDCECDLCVKDCEFLDKHCHSPKDLARLVKQRPRDPAVLNVVYSCNICSLCATVCPEDLGTGDLLLEARREAVARGDGPLAAHEPTLSFLRRGLSKTFGLLMPEPGRSRSKRLFFPGCALPGAAPRQTLEIYDELRRQFRGTGVLLHCCGAPARLLGMEEEFVRARESILEKAEAVGAEELVAACPDCARTLDTQLPDLKVTTLWERLAGTWQPPQRRDGVTVAVHDACTARDAPGVHAGVRRLVEGAGARVEEMEYGAGKARCCGLGGMIQPVDDDLSRRIARRCAAESSAPMVTYCAGCRMALAGSGKEVVHILDFLLGDDWQSALRAGAAGGIGRYANRLWAKWSFQRLRPLGAD